MDNRHCNIDKIILDLVSLYNNRVDVIQLDEHSRGILFPTGRMVNLEPIPNSDLLLIACIIGAIPQHAEITVMRLMLIFNALGVDTKGLSVGLTEANGQALVTTHLPLAGLTARHLAEKIAAVSNSAETWLDLFKRLPPTQEAPPAPARSQPAEESLHIAT